MAYKQRCSPFRFEEGDPKRKDIKKTKDTMGFSEVKGPKRNLGLKLSLGLEHVGRNIQTSKWGQKHPSASFAANRFLTGQKGNFQGKQYTPRQRMRQAVRSARQETREEQGSLIGSGWYGYGGTKQKIKRSKGFGRKRFNLGIFGSGTTGGPTGTVCKEGACFTKY